MQANTNQHTQHTFTRVKPRYINSNLHLPPNKYNSPYAHESLEERSRNVRELTEHNKKNRYDDSETEAVETSFNSAMHQREDTCNSCSTACTKKLKREISCTSELCTEVFWLISFMKVGLSMKALLALLPRAAILLIRGSIFPI